jgi:MoaA/NifB/PqqE/SkfB family radical SAM enzyme
MCHIWQKQGKATYLSVNEIDNFLSDQLLGNYLERINLTGGEPTLYHELVKLVGVFINRCPSLKNIDMPTNGINSGLVLEEIEKILALLFPTNITLSVTVSLDGIGPIHEKVRNIPRIFDSVNRTIQGIKELKSLYKSNLCVNLNATINKINYNCLDRLLNYAREHELGINFTPAAISEVGVESIKVKDKFALSNMEKEQVAVFFEKLIRDSVIDKTYGRFVINWLKNRKRRVGCIFKQGKAFLLEPTGDVYLCGNFKDFKLGNIKENKFSNIWRNMNSLKSHFWKNCDHCVSNCYL